MIKFLKLYEKIGIFIFIIIGGILLSIASPYFLKIQQETPKSEALITDGDTLWWYIPDKKQAYVYPSHTSGMALPVSYWEYRALNTINNPARNLIFQQT